MSKRRREWDEAMSLAGHEKPKDTRNNRRNTGKVKKVRMVINTDASR